MKYQIDQWTISHTKSPSIAPVERIPATVPGAVQLDYAKAFDYSPYYYGVNFKQFDWMEDEYFLYESVLDFTCREDERATLCFMGIDYSYTISVGGEILATGEGMFTPVYLDVTRYSGKRVELCVMLNPIPKYEGAPRNRQQAKACCKPASAYEWDWHPRLVPSGIWEEVYLRILPTGAPTALEASYRLSEDLERVTVFGEVTSHGAAHLTATLHGPDGKTVASVPFSTDEDGNGAFTLTLEHPKLWFPRGYGDQPIYTLVVGGKGELSRKLGFRRSKLIENTGAQIFESAFPKGPIPAPMQLEINGRRVFAKGSNWVNTEIFPATVTEERYDELLGLVCDANMNILRMWGGQYINHEYFYDKCDELGIMIWQEFMLSCNLHPDDDHYLAVLKQEATTIIKRLRTHPSLAFWCGGNELFNSWSGLTCQSHPLRMLDALCYELDRMTPFNMTSPLHGVSHGSYIKVQFPDEDRLRRDYSRGEEFICALKRSKSTAYTEFGCNGAAPKEYILKYIMDEKNYADCNENNEIWVAHHAFKAWTEFAWLGIPEVEHFFGGYESVDDLIEKSIYLQDLCYKSMFEEMRRQAPLCSMAVNWDFNEPWPCAAGNSLISWPAEPKSCFRSVKEALRPTLLSLNVPRNRYLTGEEMTGEIWMLNDSDIATEACAVTVSLIADGKKTLLATLSVPAAAERSNARGERFTLAITEELPERFGIAVECAAYPEIDSTYNFVHNTVIAAGGEIQAVQSGDMSDFLK